MKVRARPYSPRHRLVFVLAVLGLAADAVEAQNAAPSEQRSAEASLRVAEAKILSTEVALLATNKLFELAGTRSTLAEHGLDRMTFLAHILERLDSLGWQNKPDAGWSPFDVEIYGSRWARLQLLTAVEFHAGGRRMLRSRARRSRAAPARPGWPRCAR